MSVPLLLDLSHTSHSHARTGIQRVARSLYKALGERARPITHDPHGNTWRELDAEERAHLCGSTAAVKRGAQWPLRTKLRGQVQRLLRRKPAVLPENRGALVPEVFSPAVARALPELFARTHGPRVAVFHDAIALKLPDLTPRATVARFPAYMLELLNFDGIAAVSDDSRASLVDYWRWARVKNPPPVRTISLGVDTRLFASDGDMSPSSLPVVLSVGTIEGRKNHLALLEGCEALWDRGARFELHLVGLAHPKTGAPALAKVRALQSAGRPLRYDGAVSDSAVDAAYAACSFTVYPSLMEGFGLPVIESLARGKPCVCSARDAIGESARGGGCVALEQVDPASLANAIERLLHAPSEIATLAMNARMRRFKTWNEYAGEVFEWMRELPATPRVISV